LCVCLCLCLVSLLFSSCLRSSLFFPLESTHRGHTGGRCRIPQLVRSYLQSLCSPSPLCPERPAPNLPWGPCTSSVCNTHNQLAADRHAPWLSLFPQMSSGWCCEEPTCREQASWAGLGIIGGEEEVTLSS
jgi:hypothetical protein